MKSKFAGLKLRFIFLSCFLILFLSRGFAQSTVVAENDQFALVTEQETYTYKSNGKKMQGTRFAYYRLIRKGVDYSNSTKKEEAQFTYYNKHNRVEGLFEVIQNEKRGILDLKTGKMLIPAAYKSFSWLGDSIIVAKNKTETIFSLNGKKLIAAEFKDVQTDPDKKLIFDKSDKNQAFYNYKGELVASFPNTKLIQFFGNEMILQQNGKFGIYTKQGKQNLPFEYADAFFGDRYLSLAKNTASGIKYGMYTASDLKTQVFPFEYDYVRDISIYSSNEFSNGYIIFNAKQNTIQLLNEQKTELTTFNHFPDLKTAKETAKTFASLEIIHDYYVVANVDGYYRAYLLDGQSVSDEMFDQCLMYDNIFPGYVFFQGQKTLILPWKYKSGREYLFPFGIYDVSKLTDEAYYISMDYGDNIFLPYRSQPLLNTQKEELSIDYNLLENFKIAYLTNYQDTRMAYDFCNDSVIFQQSKGAQQSEDLLFAYISSKITPQLTIKPLEYEVTEVKVSNQQDEVVMYSYTDQYDQQLFYMPQRIGFNSLVVENKRFFNASIAIDDANLWSMNMVFDDHLRVIKPFSKGEINNTYIFENDTLFISDFYGASQDSSQIYSVHLGKTIYHKDLLRLSGLKYFYPNLTRHGIMNYEGRNGLISYSGKLLVPFRHDYSSADDAEFLPGAVLDFTDGPYHSYFFTDPQILVIAQGYSDYYLQNTDAYIIPKGTGKFMIYDKRTAKPVINEILTSVEYTESRYMLVAIEDDYGIFDLQELVLVDKIKYSYEEVNGIFTEKYLGK